MNAKLKTRWKVICEYRDRREVISEHGAESSAEKAAKAAAKAWRPPALSTHSERHLPCFSWWDFGADEVGESYGSVTVIPNKS